MQNMSPISSFALALDLQAGRIPVRWTLRDHHVEELRAPSGKVLEKGHIERVFWPSIAASKSGDTVAEDVDDPMALRAQLFRAFNGRWSEEAAGTFLNNVGAWRIVDAGLHEEWAKGTYVRLAYRHRLVVDARVVPVTMEDLEREVKYWYGLMALNGDPTKQKRALAEPPSADARPADVFAYATSAAFSNTLPVSLEWRGKHPRAVIETLSATELLAAAAWANATGGVPPQVCAHCQTRFDSPRKKKYCLGDCAHLVAVRNHKRKLADAKRSARGGNA